MELPYNPEDKQSILEYAKNLENKTLRELSAEGILTHKLTGKGEFGQLVEKYYFLYEINSASEPDFPKAGLEVKVSPVKKLIKGENVSKERLVLGIINYHEIIKTDFINSSFLRKNGDLLLIFYIPDAALSNLDYPIICVGNWTFPKKDLEIIKKDWELIQGKIHAGKAHEISEGDTFYLGAATKGANAATSFVAQPNNTELAKRRAFSLKSGYVNHILATLTKGGLVGYGRIIEDLKEEETIEKIVIDKFSKHYGKSIPTIQNELGINLNPDAKGFFASLTNAILGIELDRQIEEFKKADVIVKTVRLELGGISKEHVSFPAFRYNEIANETWDDSDFKFYLEQKFLFIFYRYSEDRNLILDKAKFWSMSNEDLGEAKAVWEKTVDVVRNGNIVKQVKDSGTRETNFPGKGFNRIAHVRPHASTTTDVYPLPIKDKVTDKDVYTKHSFWLNNSYIRDTVYPE